MIKKAVFLTFVLPALLSGAVITGLYNTPDPFGALPAKTTNIVTVSAGGDDTELAIYSNQKIVKRLRSGKPAGTKLTNVWNGTNDSSVAQAYGTYSLKAKSKMSAQYVTEIRGSGIDFSAPADCAVDDNGCLYTVNQNSCMIEKFAPNGVLMWKQSYKSLSPAPNGKLCKPWGVAVDSKRGYFYISDQYDTSLVRGRISQFSNANGKFTGNYFTNGGTFQNPSGLCVDMTKTNLYVADNAANLAWEIYPNSSVNNWQLVVPVVNKRLNAPTDMAVDANDNVYVLNTGSGGQSQEFLKFTKAQFQANNNPTEGATINNAYSIAIFSNSIYVSERDTQEVIHQFSTNISTSLEVYGSTGSGDGQFSSPWGIAYDSLNKKIWVCDSGNNRIQQFADPGTIVFQSKITSDPLNMSTPLYCTVDNKNNVLIVNTGMNKVTVVNNSGTFVNEFGSFGTNNGKFNIPYGIAVDENGNVYVSDQGNSRVQKFDNNYSYMTQWKLAAQPNGLYYKKLNGTNFIFVCNSTAKNVGKYRTDGTAVGQYQGSGGSKLNNPPTDVAVNDDGIMYVTCNAVPEYHRWDAQGNSLNLWNAPVDNPYGITLDPYGNFYLTNPHNGSGLGDNKIYKMSPINTNLMSFGSSGSGPGQFDFSMNLCFDSLDNIWVSDRNNNRIQKFSISWQDQKSDAVTLSDPAQPAKINSILMSGTNVNQCAGNYYVRQGLATIKISFSKLMRTDGTADPMVKFITADANQYYFTKSRYTNNEWTGTNRIPTGHDGTAILNVKDAKDLTGIPMTPNPDTSFSFNIDTVVPSIPSVSQPGTPTSLSPIPVVGSAEPNIFVHIFNYDQSSGGTLVSVQSNVSVEASGNFMANSIGLQTLTPPKSNWIFGIAEDLSGNRSIASTPRRMVVYVSPSAGNGYITPASNVFIGQIGKPWSVVYTVNSSMSNGTMTVQVPQGWAAPSTNKSSAGYTRLMSWTSMTMASIPLACTNTGSQLLIKVSFKNAIPGGNCIIAYGTNSQVGVTPSAAIGLNSFILQAQNKDLAHGWFPSQIVVPYAPGETLDVSVLPASVKIKYTNQLPHLVYRGEADILTFNLSITNPNLSSVMQVQQLKFRVEKSNYAGIIPSSAINRAEIKCDGISYLIDNTMENSGNSITLNLLGEGMPVNIPGGASKTLSVFVNIANNASASNFRLCFSNASYGIVREQINQIPVGIVTNMGYRFSFRTACAVIQSNQNTKRVYTIHQQVSNSVASAGQNDFKVMSLVFYNTNPNGNDVRVDSLRLKVERRDGSGIIPNTLISSIKIQKTNSGVVYLINNSIENSGNSVYLDLFANPVIVPKAGMNGVDIKVSLNPASTVTDFQINLDLASNVSARDKINLSIATNFAQWPDTYPNMRSKNIQMAKSFKIIHAGDGGVGIYKSFALKVQNLNGSVLSNYSGLVTLSAVNDTGEIFWTNVSGKNIVNDFGAGNDRGTYQFTPLDKGLVTLAVKDSIAESIHIKANDSLITNDGSNVYLKFISGAYGLTVSNTLYSNTGLLLNTVATSNVSIFSNAGTLSAKISGTLANYTNGALVWTIANVQGDNQVKAEFRCSSGPYTAWTLITTPADFVIHDNLTAGAKLYFYYRITTPTQTKSVGFYHSRLRVTAGP